MMAQKESGEKWDYEWYATSQTPPPLANYMNISYGDDYAAIAHLNLNFDDYKDSEIEVVIDHINARTDSDPQIVALSDQNIGAKLFINLQKQLSASSSLILAVPTITVPNGFHSYRIKLMNGNVECYYDDTLYAYGKTAYSRYNTINGIYNGSQTAIYNYKSIRRRYL